MGVGAGLYMYVVVVQKFTFAISSPDEFLSVDGGGATRNYFDPHLLLTWGDTKQNTAHVSLLSLWRVNVYVHQMKLHNSGLCDYCGETETAGHFLGDRL